MEENPRIQFHIPSNDSQHQLTCPCYSTQETSKLLTSLKLNQNKVVVLLHSYFQVQTCLSNKFHYQNLILKIKLTGNILKRQNKSYAKFNVIEFSNSKFNNLLTKFLDRLGFMIKIRVFNQTVDKLSLYLINNEWAILNSLFQTKKFEKAVDYCPCSNKI